MIFLIGLGLVLIIVGIYHVIKVFSINTAVLKEIENLASHREEMGEDNWKRIIDECTETMWDANLMLIICGGIFGLGLYFLFSAFVA